MPRPKGQTSVAKNQMQLAIALSSSLEESKTLELSKQAEELPASAIEDGAVPQNIKQMQKEFLERLQPPTRTAPTKRSKKVVSLPAIPTLLSRSTEERLRIITEKVALVLIQEDRVDWAPATIPSVGIKDNVLWDKSSSTPFEADRNSYYTASLALFVPPSNVVVGSKVSHLEALPGLLKTPVPYRSKLNASNISQPGTQTKHAFSEWSHFHQFSPKAIDQDHDTQTEMINDWERMLNNTALSDLTISLKGGKKLPAHKLVLYARCPAILNDLINKNELFWSTVTQSQALAFLEFIYSGKLARTRNLRPHVQGVAFLARKYNVTDLLKLILTFDSNEAHGSNGLDFIHTQEWNLPDDNVASGNDLQGHCLDVEESKSDIQMNITDNPLSIESNEKDDELLKDFFGTCNPTLVSGSQSCNTFSPLHASYSSRNDNTVFSSQTNVDCDTVSPQAKTTPYDLYDSEITLKSAVTSSPQCYTPNPSLQQSSVNDHNVMLHVDDIESGSVEINSRKVSSGNVRSIESNVFNDALIQDHIEISSDDELIPGLKTSISPTKCVQEQNGASGSLQLSFGTTTLRHSTKEPKSDSSKRKLTNDNSEEENWTTKKLCVSELINICSSDDSLGSCQMISPPKLSTTQTSERIMDDAFVFNSSVDYFDGADTHEQVASPNESLDSTIRGHISTPNLPQDSSASGKNLDSSFNLNNSIEYFNEVETNEPMSFIDQSPNSTIRADFLTPTVPVAKSKQNLDDSCNLNNSVDNGNEIVTALDHSSDATIIDHRFSTPKLPKDKTTARRSLTLETKMLDDSFMFDVNDSYLLREAESKQTVALEDKTDAEASFVPLRTPLEGVKTSSPVTPLPDFNAMSNQQFQTELLKYGLKRNMTKSRGVKMLKYIYGQMHPLVEVVNVQGKQLFIPIGEKTPPSTSAAATTRYPSLPSPESCNDESSSSDEEMAPVLEETIFDREEQFSQEVLGISDLKTAVKTWIFNHPELYERILRYEPIWLESIHLELKEYLNENIKLNNLMDVLDEEGITFRLAQGSRNVGRRRASPKKKPSPTKRKPSPKKQTKVRKKNP